MAYEAFLMALISKTCLKEFIVEGNMWYLYRYLYENQYRYLYENQYRYLYENLYRYLYGCKCMHYYWSLLIHVFEKISRNYHNVNSTEKSLISIKNQFGKHLYAQIMNSDAMINILSCLMLIWLHKYTYHWCPKHTQNVIYPGF